MSISEKLLHASFGRSLPEMSYCLGIYLSATVAYVAEVRSSGAKPKIEHLVKVPIPPPPADKAGTRVTGVLNTDILADTDRLAGILKAAMSAAGKWHAEYAVVTLSHTFGILRYFVMPGIDAKFWKMAVPAEAKKYIPVQFEDLVNDFQIDPLPAGPDKRPRQGALFGVTQGRNLEHVQQLLAKLGVKLAGIELSAVSVSRLWDAVDPVAGAPYAQVHFDQGNVHIVLSERGIPLFVREILMGQDAKVADRRKLDLTGCLDFSKKQLGAARPGKIRVSGETAERPAWQEALAQETQLKVDHQDTPKLLGIQGAEWAGYAAMGAAMRHLVPNRLTVDLSGAGRVDDADRRTANSLFVGAGAIAAVFLALGAYRHGSAVMKAGELGRLRSRQMAVPAFQNKTPQEIEQLVGAMKNRSNAMAAVTQSRVTVTSMLEQLVENLPEQAWLNQINYANPIEGVSGGGPEGSGRALTLQGNVAGSSEAAEQDLAIRFKEQLQRDERFQKAFGGIEISVTAAPQGAGGGDNPDAVASRRTGFSINCAGRRGG